MWYDCFNGCVRARSLGTAAQIKKKENHCWYLQVYGLILCHYLLAGFRKIQDCVMEEEEFEGLED
jgi:hypothetical protein